MCPVPDYCNASTIQLDLSTACQLACPGCSTTKGVTGAQLGTGFFRLSEFRLLLRHNPGLAHIELSNWGEIFLNPDLALIMAHAFSKNVSLSAANGVNLNHAKAEALNAIVKYRLRSMTVSIDGASQEVYSRYRVGGNFARVMEHLHQINALKRRYHSIYPRLTWQMVLFGHNQHEVEKARDMSRQLGMGFFLKRNYDPKISPIPESRGEGTENLDSSLPWICEQLWKSPQINFDGRILGCCVNNWADFGTHDFHASLTSSLNSEKIRYARRMLMGKEKPRPDIACTRCSFYSQRADQNRWVTPVLAPRHPSPRLFFNLRRWRNWALNRLDGRMIAALERAGMNEESRVKSIS